uniref:Uncharacterized protein n=1 Tax=Avena sativa TaxID=4498 RepID=A0ACD5TSN6_AVESA
MDGAAAEEGDAAVTTPPVPTCSVCMEPWTCNGDHRICCIPCGHVYGRSCLERWLLRSAHDSAKCPQCGQQFEEKLITNLYAPGNLWDGCCRSKEKYISRITNMQGTLSMLKENIAILESETDGLIAQMEEEAAKRCAELKEKNAKMHAKLKKQKARMESSANTTMALMKEQMKKMVEEENKTAADLIEFMEQSFPQPSSTSSPCALLDSENRKRRRGT